MPSNTTRIAKNTLMLYFRQILIMLVSLYTVRVVLNTLGVEDYGIYNVVAGVVTMFGFLSTSMATATQRYLSFELGRGDFEQLKKIFSLSFEIYILIAVIILLLAETVGLWFVCNKLVIPMERKNAALWIYQFAIISFVFSMLTSPYMAAIIAHEDMNIYAYVSIIEVALKLGIVFLLQLILWDKLKLYGILHCAVTLVSTTLYRTICIIKYKECKFRFYWNKKLFKEIAGYTGWSLFGSIAWLVRNQGVNIVLNIFFGPLINAARGIASQINTVVTSFGTNFSTSVYPQIIKSYAVDDKKYVWNLTIQSSKLCYFLFLVLSMPLLLETEFVLKVWLEIIPEYTVVFTRLILIDALVVSFTYALGAVNQATGNIKIYQLVIGGFLVLNLPIAIVFFTLGFGPASAMIVSIGFSASALIMRLIILKVQANFPMLMYFKKVLLIVGIVTITAMLIPLILYFSMPSTIIRFLVICFTSVLCCCTTIYFIGLSKSEKLSVQKKIQHRIKNSKIFR